MIRIFEQAEQHFGKLQAKHPAGPHIRLFVVNPRTAQAECGVSYCPPDAVEDTDLLLNFAGFDAVIDAESQPFLVDAEIDFVTDQMGSQLTLKAPNAKVRKVSDDASLMERVQYVIDSEINPQLANHGGRVSVMELTANGVAILQFGGGCNGCSQVDLTLKEGIEKELLNRFSGELSGVRDITEHQRGEHSYY